MNNLMETPFIVEADEGALGNDHRPPRSTEKGPPFWIPGLMITPGRSKRADPAW
ncbi:MAG: hypothetical protein LBG76_00890 [Treponema sp.]|jgi:hypothetical protein|nr:hypothetical protein [Treponema sp.]